MARVTVEDCVTKVPNRFELVLLATQRGRELSSGAQPSLERENDKNAVIALREIAEETIAPEELKQTLISSLQRHVEIDEPEDDSMAILAAAEKEWSGATSDEQQQADAKTVAAESDGQTVGEEDAKTDAAESNGQSGGEEGGGTDEGDVNLESVDLDLAKEMMKALAEDSKDDAKGDG